jgi:hypothetical protein
VIQLLVLAALSPVQALTCAAYGEPQEQGQLEGTPVDEASGLAYGRDRLGVWFTHNDSGGQAELYAFGLDGSYHGAHQVQGGGFVDWEALSQGPCPDGGSCLYIGDIGDNARARAYVSVYAVREPEEGAPAPVIASWHASYPDGQARDSEALLVHPSSGRIDLVSKEDAESCGLYRFPMEPTGGEVGALELVTTISLAGTGGARTVTGGDWDPDGERVVLRSYSAAFEWPADPCDPDAHWGEDYLFYATSDRQGEAIAYNAIGDLVTVSEGSPMVIKRLVCDEVGEGSGPCDTGLGDSGAEGDSPPPERADGCGCAGAGAPSALLALLGPALLRSRRRGCRDRSRRR